jgi:hemerythrin-like domain-containing protein
MDKQAEKQTLTEQLKGEMAKWQTKMDEAKVQMHLGAKEAQDKLRPHIDKLEQELSEAEKQWQELENATESAWEDIHRGLKSSLKVMHNSFEKAQQHFQKEEKK